MRPGGSKRGWKAVRNGYPPGVEVGGEGLEAGTPPRIVFHFRRFAFLSTFPAAIVDNPGGVGVAER